MTRAATDIRRLGPSDVAAMRALTATMGVAFEDPDSYAAAPPDDAYLRALLAKPHVVALAAFDGDAVVGGIVAYILDKFERARAEAYIYDLAIAESYRRRGIATALITALDPIARAAGCHEIFVQADRGDDPAIALYSGLGTRADVLHFEIPVD